MYHYGIQYNLVITFLWLDLIESLQDYYPSMVITFLWLRLIRDYTACSSTCVSYCVTKTWFSVFQYSSNQYNIYLYRLPKYNCVVAVTLKYLLLITLHFQIQHHSKLWNPHGPLAKYVKMRLAHAPGMPGTFSPILRVSDPDMHHGTCVTHVPWCMSGSLTSCFLWSRWRGNPSRHSRYMRNPQF